MKAMEHHFLVRFLVMLYKVVLSFRGSLEELLNYDIEMKATEHFLLVTLLIMLLLSPSFEDVHPWSQLVF